MKDDFIIFVYFWIVLKMACIAFMYRKTMKPFPTNNGVEG